MRALLVKVAAMTTADPPVEARTVKALANLLAKRTFDMFAQNHGQKPPLDEARYLLRFHCFVRFPKAPNAIALTSLLCWGLQPKSEGGLQGKLELACSISTPSLVATGYLQHLHAVTYQAPGFVRRSGTSTQQPSMSTSRENSLRSQVHDQRPTGLLQRQPRRQRQRVSQRG